MVGSIISFIIVVAIFYFGGKYLHDKQGFSYPWEKETFIPSGRGGSSGKGPHPK
jgi:L-asparagine transporter-like permease